MRSLRHPKAAVVAKTNRTAPGAPTPPAEKASLFALAIVEAQTIVLEANDADSLYRGVCEALVQGDALRWACVLVPDPQTQQWLPRASAGRRGPAPKQPRAAALAAPSPATSSTETVEFPLRCGGNTAAVLRVETHEVVQRSTTIRALLQKLAQSISIGLERLHQRRQQGAADQGLFDSAVRGADAAGEYVWEVDLDGRFTFLSEGIEQICGYRADELLGRKPVDLMPESERQRVRAWVQSNLGPDGALRDFEHALATRHGQLRWVRVNAVGRFDGHGRRVGQRGTGRDITERKLAEQRVMDSHRFLEELINAVPDPISVKDRDHRFIAVNDAFCRAVGCSREAVIGQDDTHLIPAEESRLVWQSDEAALTGDAPIVYERSVTLQGVKRWMLVRKSGITRSDGSRAVLAVFTDLTERRTIEQALRHSETRFRDFAAAASEFVWENDLEGRFNFVSSRVETVWGYTADDLIGRRPTELAPPGEPERVREWLAAHQQPDGSFRDLEQRILTKGGEVRWLLINAVGMLDENGTRIGQRGAARDITERKQAEARISELATRDALTGLPNRVLLNDRLQHALAAARRRQSCVGLMFIDLDRFKHVNDGLGHDVGDALLRAVAGRFRSCLRESDTLARLGGDEFVVVLDALTSADDARTVADKILRCLAAPFPVGPHSLATSASVGVSIFPDDGDDATTLMRNADTAMYHAKGMGRNAVQFFSREMNQRAVERHLLEMALREALEESQFRLAYQPQLDAATDTLAGAEALLRWHHPEWGEISPAKFIPLAEETGLIRSIGDLALREACRQLHAWRHRTKIRMAVNLSISQLRNGAEFLERVRATIEEFAVDPARIEFEITETLLASSVGEHTPVLHQLGELGCGIAVDDFGTGYSSLSYLKRLPIDTVKIDRSFVRDIVSDPDDAAIVSAVVAMAKKLKLEVIAEGVETRRQLEILREIGCDRYQGYLFSPALPADDFAARFFSAAVTA